MSTARAEGSGLVPVAASNRYFDGRVYSPAQCVGQLAENSAAKGTDFNASNFCVSVMPRFASSTRAKDTDSGVSHDSQALKALDDGLGFSYDEVETMLSYGTPDGVSPIKKFGKCTHCHRSSAPRLCHNRNRYGALLTFLTLTQAKCPVGCRR